MSTRPYPDGLDCLWLASDREGRVGAFCSAGVGPIPLEALSSDLPPVEELEERVRRLPLASRCELLVAVPRPDDFLAWAERGLFVYDWTDVHRTWPFLRRAYEPVAVPVQPIDLSSLPGELAMVAQALRLEAVDFSARKRVDVRAHRLCAAAER